MSDSTGEEQLGNKKSADKRMEEPITSYQQGESVYKIGGKLFAYPNFLFERLFKKLIFYPQFCFTLNNNILVCFSCKLEILWHFTAHFFSAFI